MDKNNLSYWFPTLACTGVPVPRTVIIETDVELWRFQDGVTPDGYEDFIAQLRRAADDFGYPVFLRTGHTSGKHDWRDTCCVKSAAEIPRHVGALVEFSELADIIGLPYNTWVIREFLPLQTSFTAFKDFPVNKERRYFIKDGEVICHHPYWPLKAVRQGRPIDPKWPSKLVELNREYHDEVDFLTQESLRVAKSFEGAWSLDWAQTLDGAWYAIDMAEASRSFHWEGCLHAAKLAKGGAA